MNPSTGTIFINYRKDDSRWNALALYNELQKYFSKEQLFKDFNTILPGDDFVFSIENALRKCDVLLVVIGAQWLDMKDEHGKRRLEDPDDFVRLEIATALNRNIQVIPVLIDNTQMPKAEDLPENLRMLYRRQFVEIDNTRFEDDVRKLADAIKKVLKYPEPDKHNKPDHKPDNPVNNNQNSLNETRVIVSKPSNNLVLSVIATIACLPIGLVGILSAIKVDGLWQSGQHTQAIEASRKAKNFSIYALIAFSVLYLLYVLALYGSNV